MIGLVFSFQISTYTYIYKHMSDIFSLLNVPELVEIWNFSLTNPVPQVQSRCFRKNWPVEIVPETSLIRAKVINCGYYLQ